MSAAFRLSLCLLVGLLLIAAAVAIPILEATREPVVTRRSTWCPTPEQRAAVPSPVHRPGPAAEPVDPVARLRAIRAEIDVLISDLDLEQTPLGVSHP